MARNAPTHHAPGHILVLPSAPMLHGRQRIASYAFYLALVALAIIGAIIYLNHD
jgi:hypothetical protein